MAIQGPTDEAVPVCDDRDTLERISRGDLEHFDAFVDRYKTRLLSYWFALR